MNVRRRKAKLSLTLPPETVRALDGAVADGRYASRSEALAGALTGWVREERRRRRDEQIDAYYDALTPEELAEDRAWASLGPLSLFRDGEQPRASTARARPRPQRQPKLASGNRKTRSA